MRSTTSSRPRCVVSMSRASLAGRSGACCPPAVPAIARLEVGRQGRLVHLLAACAELRRAPPRPLCRRRPSGRASPARPGTPRCRCRGPPSPRHPPRRARAAARPAARAPRDASTRERPARPRRRAGSPPTRRARRPRAPCRRRAARTTARRRDAPSAASSSSASPRSRRQDAHGAIHRSRIDVAVAEPLRQRAARRALPRAGGAVDRHHDPSHQASSTRAPSAASCAKKPGNETATQSGSAISTPPVAHSPATANAIAMRWSPPASTRPPASGRPSRPCDHEAIGVHRDRDAEAARAARAPRADRSPSRAAPRRRRAASRRWPAPRPRPAPAARRWPPAPRRG